MGLEAGNPVVGGTILRRAAIESPNFVHDVSGWAINQDGSAEFSNAVVRGTLIDSDEFVYNGTPAAGNPPIASICKPGTTVDPFGNAVVADAITTYNSHGKVINCLSMANSAFFQYNDSGASQGIMILSVSSTSGVDPVNGAAYGPGMIGTNPVFGDQTKVIGSGIFLVAVPFTSGNNATVGVQLGSGAISPAVFLAAPEQGVAGHLVLMMQGTSPDGTHLGQFLVARETVLGALPTPVTSALIEFQSPTTGLADSLLQLITASGGVAGDNMLGIRVSGDTSNRLRVNADGTLKWGPGNAGQDCTLQRTSANLMQLLTADLDIATAGRGLRIKEGTNARMGVSTLVAGSVVVANTTITATTRVFLTMENSNGGTPGFLQVSTRTAGTSFTIHSSSASDVSAVAWLLVEPG